MSGHNILTQILHAMEFFVETKDPGDGGELDMLTSPVIAATLTLQADGESRNLAYDNVQVGQAAILFNSDAVYSVTIYAGGREYILLAEAAAALVHMGADNWVVFGGQHMLTSYA